jgi:hypothetical protein
MSAIYERVYQDKAREEAGRISIDQEIAWRSAMDDYKSNTKDLDSSPGFGEKISNFLNDAFYMTVYFGITAGAGALALGIGAGIAGATTNMVNTLATTGAIMTPILLLGGVALSAIFDERKERDQLINDFPKIIDSDEKADSILKAGFGNAGNIVDFTKSETGLKKLVDAVGDDETAQLLIVRAKDIVEPGILSDVNRTQQPQKI